jgi:hypothetical protein
MGFAEFAHPPISIRISYLQFILLRKYLIIFSKAMNSIGFIKKKLKGSHFLPKLLLESSRICLGDTFIQHEEK